MSTRTFPALGFDPAPGELADAEDLARTVRHASSVLGEVNTVVSEGADETWKGFAADAFRGLVGDDLAPAVRDAYQSFDEAARALTGWTTTLSDQQRRADAIERRAQAALDDLAVARANLDALGPSPSSESLAEGGQPPTDAELENARDKYSRSLNAHQSTVDLVQAEYDSAVQEARNLLSEAAHDAAIVAQALVSAGHIAPGKPGLLDQIGYTFSYLGSWIADATDWIMTHVMPIIEDLVDLIGTVLAIASFFFPALAPFALGFAIAAVGIDVLRAAHGQEGALQEAFIGALGLGAGAAFGKAAQVFSRHGGPMFQPVIAGVSGGSASGGAVATAGFSVNSIAPLANAGWLVTRFHDAKGVADGIPALVQPSTNLGERVRNTFEGHGPVTYRERSERAAETAS